MTKPEFDLERFQRQLREAVLWCNYRLRQYPEIPVAEMFRSVVPRPATEIMSSLSVEEHKEFAETVFDRRSSLLKAVMDEPTFVDELQALEGRFLVFYQYGTVSDGAAQVETEGYFDFDTYPPYDTWVYYFTEEADRIHNGPHILSWVPPEFLSYAEGGLNTDPVECIKWLTEIEPEYSYVSVLRDLNLLS